MNIIEIYKKYHLIIDNWTGQEIDKEAIIRVCLLHDMGNIVKIPEDFSKEEEFIKIRKKYIEQYGTNDHEINLEIGKQEGLIEKEIMILYGKRSRKNEETIKSDSYERKICAYCDQRVAPDGVVGIKERLEDAKVRYKDKPLSVWSNEEKANRLIECSLGIENK